MLFILSVSNKPFMLSVVMLSVVYAECRYAECRGALEIEIEREREIKWSNLVAC